MGATEYQAMLWGAIVGGMICAAIFSVLDAVVKRWL